MKRNFKKELRNLRIFRNTCFFLLIFMIVTAAYYTPPGGYPEGTIDEKGINEFAFIAQTTVQKGEMISKENLEFFTKVVNRKLLDTSRDPKLLIGGARIYLSVEDRPHEKRELEQGVEQLLSWMIGQRLFFRLWVTIIAGIVLCVLFACSCVLITDCETDSRHYL
jgi:hypothetical protein